VMSLVAVTTPYWLIMLDRLSRQYHSHGLWQVCVQTAIEGPDGGVAIISDEACTFSRWPERGGPQMSADDQMHSLVGE
jgi:hypothetical protein